MLRHRSQRRRLGLDRPVPAGSPVRVGGHARPTCAPSLTRSFTCCEPVASGACYPVSFPRPGTVYHYFRAWKDAGVLAELQRALHEQARLKPRPLALPFGGHPGQSVGQDHRARRSPWFRYGHKRVKGRKRHLLVDTLGMVVARRVEAANVSDRRVGARLLAGLQSGFPGIRTVMADAGYESRTLARELKRCHGLATAHHQTPAARLQGGGHDLDRGAHVCVAGQKSSLEQRLRVEGPNFGSLHRPGGHSPHAQAARPRDKTSQTPSKA
jgi:transposase